MQEETERLHNVRLLLETMLDYLPSQYRSALSTTSGPAPSRNVPCETCHGKGKVRQGKTIRLCPRCDGEGWRRRRAGEVKYDEYTGEQVADQDDRPLRTMTIQEINTALASIERDTAEREGRTLAWDELGWLRKRDSMRRHGSYAELEEAIRRSLSNNPRAVRVTLSTYVLGHSLPWEQEDLAIEGLMEIAHRMRGEIRVPPWYRPDEAALKQSVWRGRTPRHEEQRGQRNEKIRQARAEGHTIGQLARAHNLTKRQIRRIVN